MSSRGLRVDNDPEMREVIVRELAQWILRGRAHTINPPPTEAEILTQATESVTDAAGWGFRYPDGEAERVAADATEKADYQQETNVNWDQWAFHGR